jgi:hypothetical protein
MNLFFEQSFLTAVKETIFLSVTCLFLPDPLIGENVVKQNDEKSFRSN